ncbi:MAG: NAD(P)H-binding protein, partial [Candidatus Aminicenantes bacterium]
MDMTGNPIIVFGGTGYYGRYIVRSLIRKGEDVKVLSRDKARAKKILGDEPEIIEGDITRRESVIESLKGTKAIILSISAFHPKLIRKIRRIERDAVLMILKKAKSTGIARVVYLSGYEMRENFLRNLRLQKFGAIKIEIEKALIGSELNWTILGCAPSMELFFTFLKKDKMIAPGGGAKAIPCISSQDVGEIAAQAVLRSDLKGKRFRLTGPEAFTFPQAAQRMARISGIPV